MTDEVQTRKKRGAATVLALLVSFLLGSAPAAAQASTDQSSRLSQTEYAKRGATLRTSVRAEADDGDCDCPLLSAPPRVVTLSGTARPADDTSPVTISIAIGERTSAYRARAPPAA